MRPLSAPEKLQYPAGRGAGGVGPEKFVPGGDLALLRVPSRWARRGGQRDRLGEAPNTAGSRALPGAGMRPAGGKGAARRAPNACRLLGRRAHGFYARDAGVALRKNMGLLRSLLCQVAAPRGGLASLWVALTSLEEKGTGILLKRVRKLKRVRNGCVYCMRLGPRNIHGTVPCRNGRSTCISNIPTT